MKKLKSIIVDDEQDSREILRNYTMKYTPVVQVVEECSNIQEAKKAIQKHQPDLVFLDIEMPYGNAFDLLEQLDEIDFQVIFITAFSQYAIQAFNQSAVHYILKPLDIDELIVAVQKAQERIQDEARINHTQILLENIASKKSQKQKIALPLMDGFEVVKLSDVLYCEANDNFTKFHFVNGKKALICRKLKFYEDNLKEYGFCRVHRSHLINLDYVKRYVKGKGGMVVLENEVQIQVSSTRKQAFLAQFK